MDFFEEATLRLKQQLKLSENKQVAQAIGMTSNAWTKRKQRGVFPEKELRAFAQQHPDLNINVDYVLTGGLAGSNVAEALGRDPRAVAGPKTLAALDGSDMRAYAAERVQAAANVSPQVAAVTPQYDEGELLTAEEVALVLAYRSASSAGRAAIVLAAKAIGQVSGQGKVA